MVQGTFFPRRWKDRALFLFMVLGVPFALWFELFVVVPVYYPVFSNRIVIHITCGLFIAFNALANMYFVIVTDSSTEMLTGIKDQYTKMDWKHCEKCKRVAPPRSYHCPHCDECILKRDHHCMFTGCCVGYHNHRYFLFGMLYLWLGALYGNLFTIHFFITQLGGYHLQTFLTLLGPHIAVMFGVLTPYTFTISVLFMLAAVVLLATSWLFLWQVYLISKSQTMYESKHGISVYDNELSLYERFRDVAGTRWYLALINPWASSPLTGSGIYHTLTDTHSGESERGKKVS